MKTRRSPHDEEPAPSPAPRFAESVEPWEPNHSCGHDPRLCHGTNPRFVSDAEAELLAELVRTAIDAAYTVPQKWNAGVTISIHDAIKWKATRAALLEMLEAAIEEGYDYDVEKARALAAQIRGGK